MTTGKIYNDETLYFLDELTLLSGDIANRTNILDGGSLIVSSGATANSTIIDAVKPDEDIRELIVRGTANHVIDKGGTVEVLDGGAAWFVTVSGNGIVSVKDGGTATDITVNEAGTLRIFAGGSANSVTVENAGTLILENGASVSAPVLREGAVFGYDFNASLLEEENGTVINLLDAGTSDHYIICSGETQTVGDGLVSSNAEVLSNGTQHVLAGGKAEGTAVESGGTLIVETGGTALNVSVEKETDISYDFGTVVTAWKKEDGEWIRSTPESSCNYSIHTQQDVRNGYIAFGGFVLENAVQNIEAGGEASYMTVRAEGVQNVLEGGRANVTAVFGEMVVASGGVANYAEVKDGSMTVRSGGTAGNTDITVNTILHLEEGAILKGITSVTGQIQTEGTVTVDGILNFNLIQPGFLHSGVSPESVPYLLINDISCFEGAGFRLSIAPEQVVAGEFRLAGNAADFRESITVVGVNDQIVYSELDLMEHTSFSRNGMQYTLALNEAEELVLRIEALPQQEPDTEAPLKLRRVSANVYAGFAVTLHWDEGVDNVGVTGYEVRYAEKGSAIGNASITLFEEESGFIGDLAEGEYLWQVRAVDAAGNKGEWSDPLSFRISAGNLQPDSVISTELWGHDFLPELYSAPDQALANDVSGYYFADAEKLNTPQDMLYCWGAAASNILTWTGWAANSPLEFRNEDELFEYFIDYWKNEGGLEQDAFSWFFNGTGNSGTITVPTEGGNLFPQLDISDFMFFTNESTETDTLLDSLTDAFDAGYGIAYAIYSDQGLSHAITGWGYEVDENGDTWLYYSDSDSDYWSGSDNRRDAVNRLSKTRTELRSDGRFYLLDYQVEGAYLGSFAALKQFDPLFLGREEDFEQARFIEFDGLDALRAGNLDGENDDDYYRFVTPVSCDLQITVSLASADPALRGISLSLYNSQKQLLQTLSDLKTEQTLSFHSTAGETCYLLVQGDALVSDSATVPALNTYYIQIAADPDAETRKNAGISSADDSWRQVLSEDDFIWMIPGDSPELEPIQLFSVEVDADGAVVLEDSSNWIGPEDKKDLRAFQVETSGSYHFTLPALESNARLTIYKLNNDKLKTVKRVSVNPKTGEEKRGIFNLLLDAGITYFVETESTKKTGTFYNVEFSGEVFVRADNTDDSEAAAWANPDLTVSTEKSSEAAGTLSLSLFGDNWVGYNDQADFRILNLADAGNYTFTLSQLDEKATGTFTIREIRDDGKTRKVFSLSGSSSKSKEKANVLLKAGTYLISFESKSWKKGRNTGYAVELSGTVFGKADSSDDQWRNAVSLAPFSSVVEGWVGYSDLQDWSRFTVDSETLCSLELSEVTGNGATLLLYRRNIKGDVEKTPSKMVSTRAKDGVAELEEFLSAGTYYLAVKAEGSVKKSGTAYKLNLKFSEPETSGMLA